MDESRSGHRLRELIIEDKKIVKLPRKLAEFSFGTLCWGILVILWIPLISFLVWLAGLHVFSSRMWGNTDFGLQITIVLFSLMVLLLLFNVGLYKSYLHNQPKQITLKYDFDRQTETNNFFAISDQQAEDLKTVRIVRFGFQENQENPLSITLVNPPKKLGRINNST